MFKKFMGSWPKSESEQHDQKSKAEFINVPIQLLSGFIDDTRLSIRDIYHYSLYAQFVKLDKGSDKEKYRRACEWLNFQELDREENLRHGKVLFERYLNSPMTGIERSLYTEYNKHEKSEFDKACFLAFHALKSIVGNKTFQKTDNKLLWARMDGKIKTIQNVEELSDKVRFFTQEYQTLKIKRELQENWGVVYYAQQTRGFYVSFKMDLKSLIMEVLKRKRKTLEKQRLDTLRSLEKEAIEEITRLQLEPMSVS
jgi:hypothetical protein